MLVSAKVRLAILVGALLAVAAAVYVFDLVRPRDVREWADSFGALAPLMFVPLAGVLGALLVPGALLAAAAGALFGAGVGTLVSISAAVVSAVLAVLLARHTGAERGMRELSGERLLRLRGALERHGVLTVAAQRLLPAVPDGPMSHAFGLLGVKVRHIALGTVIGAAPRAFSYAALGASLDDPESPLAIAGVAGLVITALIGAGIARRWLRRTRPVA